MTLPQNMEALELANRAKRKREAVREQIRLGEVSLGSVISDPPDEMRSATVQYALMCVQYVGRDKARGISRRAGVDSTTRLDKLTVRQRFALLEVIGEMPVFKGERRNR